MGEHNQNTNIIDLAVKLAGVAGSAAFLISVFYDFFFYHALGLSFADIPTSFTDHLRTALIWFPLMLGSSLGFVLSQVVDVLFKKGMTDEEIIQSSPSPDKTMKILYLPVKIMFYTSFVLIFLYILFGDFFVNTLFIAFALLSIPSWWLIYDRGRLNHHLSNTSMKIISWITVLIILVGGFAYIQGKSLLNIENMNYKLVIKKNGNMEISCNVIRFYEKGVLFITKQKDNIYFLQWGEIEEVKKKIDRSEWEGLIFDIFGISPKKRLKKGVP